MAESNFTPDEKIVADLTEDACDVLSRKAAQLSALLTVIVGEGFDSFNLYNDEIKQNYLWACQDLAWEVKSLSGRVVDR